MRVKILALINKKFVGFKQKLLFKSFPLLNEAHIMVRVSSACDTSEVK